MPINEQLLEILACPLTKAPVVQEENWIISTDKETRRRYPIRDDIPVMLIDEAEEMNYDEWAVVMKKHNVQIG